jgi:hypothetical protein
VLWLVYGTTAFLFEFYTAGLAVPDVPWVPGGIGHIRDFFGTAGNDNICILVGVVFAAVGTFWALVRGRGRFGIWDYTVHLVLLTMQAFFTVMIEQGSVVTTIVDDGNIVLAIWTMTYLALWAVLLGSLFRAELRRRTPMTGEMEQS